MNLPKQVPNPSRMCLTIDLAVVIRVGDHKIHMSSGLARAIADQLSLGHDAVEAFVFVLRQGADGVEALAVSTGDTIDRWIQTQPERP